jgi:hypothetical protein
MKRFNCGLALAVVAIAAITALGAGSARAAVTCTPTGFVRDAINLTAALINPGKVTGTVDATGCNIGVYYGPGSKGQINKAEIFGSNYYGVVNNGGKVDVQNSNVHNIGEVPFNGTQHGVGIYFAYDTGATGSIANNTVSAYQKGGIVVNGGSDSADIHNNTVTGLGRVNFIAGNGIQVAFGASGDVHNNTVTGNAYTGANNASSAGILVFGGCGDPTSKVDVHDNTLMNNDMGIYFANYNATCDAPSPTPTKGDIHNNTISNDGVTNVSGFGSPTGYQAGINEIGNGDDIHNNTISGPGYAPENNVTAFVLPIDITSFPTLNVKSHNNTYNGNPFNG